MKLIILVFTFTTLNSFASLKGFELLNKCSSIKMSDDQKQEIETLVFKTHMQIIDLIPKITAKKKIYQSVILNPETTQIQAEVALKQYKESMDDVKFLKKQAKSKINFEILSGEQRVQFLKCKSQHNIKLL